MPLINNTEVATLNSAVTPQKPVQEESSLSAFSGVLSEGMKVGAKYYDDYKKGEAKKKLGEDLREYGARMEAIQRGFKNGDIDRTEMEIRLNRLKNQFVSMNPDKASLFTTGDVSKTQEEQMMDAQIKAVAKYTPANATQPQRDAIMNAISKYNLLQLDLGTKLKKIQEEKASDEVKRSKVKETMNNSIYKSVGIAFDIIQPYMQKLEEANQSGNPELIAIATQNILTTLDKAKADITLANGGVLKPEELNQALSVFGYLKDQVNNANGNVKQISDYYNFARSTLENSTYLNYPDVIHLVSQLPPELRQTLLNDPETKKDFVNAWTGMFNKDKQDGTGETETFNPDSATLKSVIDITKNLANSNDPKHKEVADKITNNFIKQAGNINSGTSLEEVSKSVEALSLLQENIPEGTKVNLSKDEKEDASYKLTKYFEKTLIKDFKTVTGQEFKLYDYNSNSSKSYYGSQLIIPSFDGDKITFSLSDVATNAIKSNAASIKKIDKEINLINNSSKGGPLSPEMAEKKQELIKQKRSYENFNNGVDNALKTINDKLVTPSDQYIKSKMLLDGSKYQDEAVKMFENVYDYIQAGQ